MRPSSVSYLKTAVSAALLGALVIGLTLIAAHNQAGISRAFVEGAGWLVGLASECVALGGVVALYRSKGLAGGHPDLFLRSNASRDLEAVSRGKLGWGNWVRRLFRVASGASHLLVGDLVDVRPLKEIEDTLDESGCLDGLPFMPEMAGFCGRRFRVFRCVDKILDFGRSWRLRRLEDAVLLAGLRCDGGAHGGCQASCYLLWKTAWLRTVRDEPERRDGHRDGCAEPVRLPLTVVAEPAAPSCYTCQFTQLTEASSPISRWDVRQDLRSLLTGNVTLSAFCVAVLTRLFNGVQRLFGGSAYPPMSRGRLKKTPVVRYGFAPGDTVRVLGTERIAATLDEKSRNRGLSFDEEMIKHCGRQYRVAMRIERILEKNGRILEMKTPCVALEGVDSSGEFLRFCTQHEYLFWREAWLEPAAGPRTQVAASAT
jgi:hypothetical protein